MSLLEKDKRKFNVIIGSKKYGVCYGASPSGAARKVKVKLREFYLKETTKGSKKKLYGPYSNKKVVQRGGLREKLCLNLINFFLRCPAYNEKKNDDGYKSIENALRLLGIHNFNPQRYIKLKDLIFLRTQDKTIPFCQLLCSENPNLSENELDNEVRFIVNSRDIIGMPQLSMINWINFIIHFKLQLKNMEIRNHICLGVINVLNTCEHSSHQAHFKDLLPNVYTKLGISSKQEKCNILKSILKLREEFTSGQTPSLLDVLFNITENLMTETMFIDKKYIEIKRLLGYLSITKLELTNMWNNVIKYIRKFIDDQVIEIKEGIEATSAISIKNLEKWLKNLEEAKEKERKNQEILNRLQRELEEAKASFARNGKKPIIRGFAKEAGPAKAAEEESNLRELGINPNGSSAANPQTNISQIPPSMLQPVGRRRNVKPIQQSHNNPKTAQGQPASTNNLEAEKQRYHESLLNQLYALTND